MFLLGAPNIKGNRPVCYTMAFCHRIAWKGSACTEPFSLPFLWRFVIDGINARLVRLLQIRPRNITPWCLRGRYDFNRVRVEQSEISPTLSTPIIVDYRWSSSEQTFLNKWFREFFLLFLIETNFTNFLSTFIGTIRADKREVILFTNFTIFKFDESLIEIRENYLAEEGKMFQPWTVTISRFIWKSFAETAVGNTCTPSHKVSLTKLSK